MVDFFKPSEEIKGKSGVIEIKPDFDVNNDTEDMMIRGRDFYAIWVESKGLWSTNEQDAIRIIDN